MNRVLKLRKNEKVQAVYVTGLLMMEPGKDYQINKKELIIPHCNKKDTVLVKTETYI